MLTAILISVLVATASAHPSPSINLDYYHAITSNNREIVLKAGENLKWDSKTTANALASPSHSRNLRMPTHDPIDFHLNTLLYPPGSQCGVGDSPMMTVDDPFMRSQQCDSSNQAIINCENTPNGIQATYALFDNSMCQGTPISTQVVPMGLPPPCTSQGVDAPMMTMMCYPGPKRPNIGQQGLIIEGYADKNDCRGRNNPDMLTTLIEGQCMQGTMVTGCQNKDVQYAFYDTPDCSGVPKIVDERINKSSQYVKRHCKKDSAHELDRCSK